MALQDCTLNLNRIRRELQSHGTPSFPYTGYSSVYTDNAGDMTPWHWHEDSEVIHVESGHLKLQAPSETLHLKQGEDVVANSSILHFAAAEPLYEFHSLVFYPLLATGEKDPVFSRRYVAPLLRYRSFDTHPFDYPTGDLRAGSPAAVFTAALDVSYDEPLGYELVIREKLSCVYYCLYTYYPHAMDSSKPMPDMDNIRIQRVISLVHEHSQEDLDLAQIARVADIGEREYLRYFKRVIQTFPLQYLLKYRMTQRASMFLRSPHNSISSIADMRGFNNPSNFSQMFVYFPKCTLREHRKTSCLPFIFP